MLDILTTVVPAIIALAGVPPGLEPPGRAPGVERAAQDSLVGYGAFNRVDRSHWARGTARLFTTAGGRVEVRFGDAFEAARGPDLRVVLSEAANPRRGRDLGDFVELDRLERSEGAQTYVVPADVDLARVASVVIYCKRFNVIFSVARLSAPTD